MALILNLETSTKNCSVALADNGQVIECIEESSDQYIHSEKLHVFIDQVLKEAKATPQDLGAIAVGKGPGSYTGLRIGISAAKGFAYTLSIPLISMDGLQLLTERLLQEEAPIKEGDIIIPMIDARRMEVFCAVYNYTGQRQTEIEAKVIDETSFSELQSNTIHLLGDGSDKCRETLRESRFQYHSLEYPSAKELSKLSYSKFLNKEFEDTAYFEPFYLKDFIAGKPKKLL